MAVNARKKRINDIIIIFFRPTAQSRRLNIVLSKVWLQRRLIGVKRVDEGDRPLKQKGGFSGFASD